MTTGLASLKVETAENQDPIATASPTWTDVTAKVQKIQTNRGRDEQWQPHSPGTATITLKVPNSSALNGGLALRISMADSGSTRRYLFAGFVNPTQQVQYSTVGKVSTVTVQCYDALGYLSSQVLPDTLQPVGTYVPIVETITVDGKKVRVLVSNNQTPLFGGSKSGTVVTTIALTFIPLFPAWQTAVVDTGQTILQDITFARDALTIFQNIAQSEGGAFWVDGAGNIRFDDRYAPFTKTRMNTPQLVLDDTGATGVSYAFAGFNWVNCPLYTSASVTQTGAQQTFTYDDASAFANFGHITYPAITDGLMMSPTEAEGAAQRLVLTSNDPVVMGQGVVIDPRRKNATLDAALQTELRDQVTFSSVAAGLPEMLGAAWHVERIQHDIDLQSNDWKTTFGFSSRDQFTFNTGSSSWLKLNDATLGKLDNSRDLAY